jgi:ParB family chromosome partitioning protein
MLEGLDLLGTRPAPQDGAPMQLPVDAIDEDPGQPRFEFDEESLHELAATIRERGVRQPISVRPSPAAEGRWLLNFGARRLRASKLAGRSDIPAFVDVSADSYDQVIENEQREGLKPLELALFIQRRLAAGDSQAEVARRIGKSKAYVTYAMALIDAPDWLMSAYREGRCSGLRELYDLRRAGEAGMPEMASWLEAKKTITRRDLLELRAATKDQGSPVSAERGGRTTETAPINGEGRRANGSACQAVRVYANLGAQAVRVCLDRTPSYTAHVFARAHESETWRAVALSALSAVRIELE